MLIFNLWHKNKKNKIRGYETINIFTKRTEDKTNGNNKNNNKSDNNNISINNSNNNNNNNNNNNDNNNNNNSKNNKKINNYDPTHSYPATFLPCYRVLKNSCINERHTRTLDTDIEQKSKTLGNITSIMGQGMDR